GVPWRPARGRAAAAGSWRPRGWQAPADRLNTRHRARPASLMGVAALRELDAEDGLAGPRVGGDLAVVALDDDAAGDVKAQPGALAGFLGGVERLERPGQYLGRHSAAGVGDLDDNVPGDCSCRDAERSVGVHGVDGVVDDVRPRLVEVGRVRLDVRHAGAV